MKKTWNYWIASLLFTMACIAVNSTVFAFPGMLPLEFAHSAGSMQKYIEPVGYHRLLLNTLVDYAFLISYSLLAFFSFKILLNVFQGSIKPWVYFLSFITGVLDAIENIFLLATAIKQNPVYSWVYAWAVRIKWAFAMVIFLVIIIIVLYGIVVLLRAKQPGTKQ